MAPRHPRCHPESHLTHDLAAVEQHLVPLAEAVAGRLLRRRLWGRGGDGEGTRMSPPCHPRGVVKGVAPLTLEAEPPAQRGDGHDDDGEAQDGAQHLGEGGVLMVSPQCHHGVPTVSQLGQGLAHVPRGGGCVPSVGVELPWGHWGQWDMGTLGMWGHGDIGALSLGTLGDTGIWGQWGCGDTGTLCPGTPGTWGHWGQGDSVLCSLHQWGWGH